MAVAEEKETFSGMRLRDLYTKIRSLLQLAEPRQTPAPSSLFFFLNVFELTQEILSFEDLAPGIVVVQSQKNHAITRQHLCKN